MAKLILSFVALILVICLLAAVQGSYDLDAATKTNASQQQVEINPDSLGCKVVGGAACDAASKAINDAKSVSAQADSIIDGANQLNDSVNNAVDQIIK